MVIALRNMQTAASTIWTRVAVPISNDDKHYTTGNPLISSMESRYINKTEIYERENVGLSRQTDCFSEPRQHTFIMQ